jgi:hypothetical protein
MSLSLGLAVLLSGSALADTNPVVSVTVNGITSTTVFRGMPLLVSVWLAHSDAMSTSAVPILIAGTNGVWTNSIQLNITDATTNSQAWPFQSTAVASNTVTLDSVNLARIDRWLTPTQTLTLSTGQYTLAVTLDSTGVTNIGAWVGTARSVPANVIVVDEPVPLAEADAENKYLQLAEYYLFRGDAATSLVDANALLALFPTNITGLRLKAEALAANGQAEQAGSAVAQAINEVYTRDPSPKEPPVDLFSLSRKFQQQKLTAPALGLIRTNQQVQLTWPAYAEFFYWIETSTDLKHWSLLVTNPAGNVYSVPIVTSPGGKFYRLGRADLGVVMAPPYLQFTPPGPQFKLSWFGYPWFNYRIDVSSNLVNWSVLATNFNAAGNLYSFSIQPGPTQKFFRIAR